MELLKEIKEKDVFPEGSDEFNNDFKVRKSSRGVLFDDKGRIALLFVSKINYHKLPGGGFDPGEDAEEAFRREILEETGCECETSDEIGLIIEYRNKINKLQLSYCYSARVTNNTGVLNLSEKERRKGFKLEWFDLDEAIRIVKNENPEGYKHKFITLRDYTILLKAEELLG